MTERSLSFIDQVICGVDRALRSVTSGTKAATRDIPQPSTNSTNTHSFDESPENTPKDTPLNETERRHSAGLMRVNHSGEVCAQALYQGQALTAKLPHIRDDMERAADEEIDHLAWCESRLVDLDARPSLFNPLWYGMSFSLGAAAGLVSDRVSLGFVAATEDQVCEHLRKHLDALPENDHESRAVLEQMIVDEEKHGMMALEAGGYDFPRPVKKAMMGVSTLMTSLSYRI